VRAGPSSAWLVIVSHHLGLSPQTARHSTLLLTPVRGDVYLIGEVPKSKFSHDAVPHDHVQHVDAPAYSSAPRTPINDAGVRPERWQPATRAGSCKLDDP
jgi:hypothetical protein